MAGLHGIDLIIDFGNAKNTLGCFVRVGGKPHKFRFSKVYFEDDTFSIHEAYDVIRHEYAHYMNHEIHGDMVDGKHSEKWKECCRRVGARPISIMIQRQMRFIFTKKERRLKRNELNGIT